MGETRTNGHDLVPAKPRPSGRGRTAQTGCRRLRSLVTRVEMGAPSQDVAKPDGDQSSHLPS